MTGTEGLIHTLYTSFQVKDWRTMQTCYHEEAIFSDPVFQNLTAKETRAMWHMLTSSAQDLKILFSDVTADASKGSCSGKLGTPSLAPDARFTTASRQPLSFAMAKYTATATNLRSGVGAEWPLDRREPC